MRLRDDERGQSVQIGAVLLFAVLIVAFSSYQAFVVPDQNRAVEFDHSQSVRGEMQDLRNAIVSTSGGGRTRATSVTLGTRYPSRAVGLNPGPATGTLRTEGTDDDRVNVSIGNAEAVDGEETRHAWDGLAARNYSTGAIVYRPHYNLYGEAPTTTYEHTALYDEFRDGATTGATPTLVDGNTINVVTVDGSLSRTSSGSTSVDVRPVSSSTRTIRVSAADDSEPLTIDFASRLHHSEWAELIDASHVTVGPGPADPPEPFHHVRLELDAPPGPDDAYRLQMTKVAAGPGATDEDPAYLTVVDGDGATVTRGQSHDVTLEVRDAYNNPVPGVEVHADLAPGEGSVDLATETTGDDGRVTFTYEPGSRPLNATIDDDAVLSDRPFPAAEPEHADVEPTVQSGSPGSGDAAYDVSWTNPADVNDNGGADLSDCSPSSCTWDVGNSDDDDLTLESVVEPGYHDVDLDFAVSDPSVGIVSPGEGSTDNDGSAKTVLTAHDEGTVDVQTSANTGSSGIEITVQNTGESDGPGDDQPPTFGYTQAQASNRNGNQNDAEVVTFNIDVNDDVEIDRVEVAVYDGGTDFGSDTFSPPVNYEELPLEPRPNMQSTDATVEITAFDTSDNYRTCSGTIENIDQSIDTDGELTCNQTST